MNGKMNGVTNALCLTVVMLSAVQTAQAGFCSAYCDLAGHYKSGFYCVAPQPSYCCGTEHYRYCCPNVTLDITGVYPDVYWCENSSWWIFNWQVLTGLLTTSLIVMLCSACCCKCCHTFQNRHRRRNQDDIHVISENVDENGSPIQTVVFDPESPHAFTPPEYGSLPKDPPKYHDLYTWQAYGNVNQGYVVNEPSQAEIASGESAPARVVSGDDVTAGVHAEGNPVEQSTADNQAGLPEGPPPSYSESQTTCPTPAEANVENEG